MPIRDHCREQVVTAKPPTSAREAAELMKRESCGSLVVVERNHPVGILTDRDVALGTLAAGRDPEKTTVRELMSEPAVTVPEDASVPQAIRILRRNGLRRLPVVDDKGRVVGIVSADDLLRLVSGELARLGEAVAQQTPGHTAAPAEVR